MKIARKNVGNGRLNFSVIFFAFILSLCAFPLCGLVEKIVAVPFVIYALVQTLQFVLFFGFLSLAMLPKLFPFGHLWVRPNRPSLHGRYIRVVATLILSAVIVEVFVQFASGFYANFMDPISYRNTLRDEDNLVPKTLNYYILFFGKNNWLGHLIVGPFVEEWIFRGVVLNYFFTKFKTGLAVLLSSVLFGVLHSNYVSAFLGGIFLSYIYIIYGRLWMCVLIHGFGNLLILLAVNTQYVEPFLELLTVKYIAAVFAAIFILILVVLTWIHLPLLRAKSNSPFEGKNTSY